MSDEVSEESFWMGMIKKHWYVLIIYGIALAGLIAGGFIVLWKYIESWSYSILPSGPNSTFDEFSLGIFVLWIIWLILWELLYVWLPVIGYCIIVTVILWYKIIPEEDKQAIKSREKKEKKKTKKAAGGSGGAGFLFFLVFMLVVYIDGNYWTLAGNLNYSYYLYAYLVGMFWVFIVLGIPFLIIIIIYVCKKWRKTPE